MHELTVTESLLEIALRHAEKAKAQRITALNLVIGQMASIVDESIQFYWTIIANETIAREAQLNFRRIQTEFTCQACKTVYNPLDDTFLCPHCQSENVRLSAGDEFFLESIEVES